MSDLISQSDNQVSNPVDPLTTPPARSRRWLRFAGILLILISVLTGWYLLVGYVSWQNGQAALVQRREIEGEEQISRQINLAQENIGQGSYNLALRRLEWVLQRSPGDPQALKLREEAQAALTALLTPEPAVVAEVEDTPTPTPRPLPTPTAGPIDDPRTELQRIRRLMANQEWETAVSTLVTLQRQFPDFERQETDELLYDAYINLGLQLVEGEQVELGLFYLEQAEKLGDLPQEVLDYRFWAELYLQGMAFYGANWETATFYFRDLCLAAPFYQSSCDLLRESLINLADFYADTMDYCPAEGLYQEASQYGRTQTLVEKLTEAREACLTATPTPFAPAEPITDTEEIIPDAPFDDLPRFVPTEIP